MSLDKIKKNAADNVQNIVNSINQKQKHKFRGVIRKVNILSTPTKRKDGGEGVVELSTCYCVSLKTQ